MVASTSITEWVALIGAVASAIVGIINAITARASHAITKDTNTVITKELTSNDGSTLRDATDRIESTLGTTPPLPRDKQVYTATDVPDDMPGDLERKANSNDITAP